jgi:hypothetical protein
VKLSLCKPRRWSAHIHALASLPPGKYPPIDHWKIQCTGPKIGIDVLQNNLPSMMGIEPRPLFIHSIAQSLDWLRYSGHRGKNRTKPRLPMPLVMYCWITEKAKEVTEGDRVKHQTNNCLQDKPYNNYSFTHKTPSYCVTRSIKSFSRPVLLSITLLEK